MLPPAAHLRVLPPRADRQAILTAALLAVQQRLRAAAGPLGFTQQTLDQAVLRCSDHTDVVGATAELIEQATAGARRLGGVDRLWLLLTCVQGQFPTSEDVLRLRRNLELDDGLAASRFLLASTSRPVGDFSALPAVLVHDQVVVDTGHTAGGNLNTGIQRVVREVLRRWTPGRPVLPVAWTEHQSCTRTLTAAELQRTSRWGVALETAPTTPIASGPVAEGPVAEGPLAGTSALPQLVIPWRSTYLVPELPLEPERLARLIALARYSGTRVVLIGYDLIPVTNAAAVGGGLAALFAHYLSMVKHSAKIIAISETAALEFRGLNQAFAAQGLALPEVVTCALPTAIPPSGGLDDEEQRLLSSDAPLVLSVGSVEMRKNHLALLHAAEVLWREGLHFRLLILGKVNSASTAVVTLIDELRAAGRDVEVRSGVSDTALGAAYRAARLTVFMSTHEGYGLPVAESIASGTPVVTTCFGSTAEAALGGGALLVDPRDDDAIAAAIRTLLTDDVLHASLVAQCHARPPRTWDDYCDEIWSHLQPSPEVTG